MVYDCFLWCSQWHELTQFSDHYLFELFKSRSMKITSLDKKWIADHGTVKPFAWYCFFFLPSCITALRIFSSLIYQNISLEADDQVSVIEVKVVYNPFLCLFPFFVLLEFFLVVESFISTLLLIYCHFKTCHTVNLLDARTVWNSRCRVIHRLNKRRHMV